MEIEISTICSDDDDNNNLLLLLSFLTRSIIATSNVRGPQGD